MLIDLHPYTDSGKRFIHIAVKNETIWTLISEHGYACCHAENCDADIVLLFWSSKTQAIRVGNASFEDYVITQIPLRDFILKTLPEMAADGVSAGPNFTEDLTGVEIEPIMLRDEIIESMPREMRESYFDTVRKDGTHHTKVVSLQKDV